MAFDLKSIDTSLLKKMMDPKSTGDFNAFVDKLPQHAGQQILIAAGIVWAMAGALGLYTSVQARGLTELRMELKESKALKPVVPTIKETAVPDAELKKFAEQAQEVYDGLHFQVNGGTIIITSTTTSNFAKFREAIGHMQNGGAGWRVSLDKLCVGRECDQQHKLAVALKVNKVSVEGAVPPT